MNGADLVRGVEEQVMWQLVCEGQPVVACTAEGVEAAWRRAWYQDDAKKKLQGGGGQRRDCKEESDKNA